MPKALGVEFAPINIPLNRRLQTFAVAQFLLCFFCGGFSCLLFSLYLVFCTRFYFIPLIYLLWYVYDRQTPHRGGRRVAWVQRWKLWEHYRDYFPLNVIKTADLDPKKNYIIGYHPHGVVSLGAIGNFALNPGLQKTYPGLTTHPILLTGHFSFPFYRDYLMTAGCCASSKESITWLINKENGTGRGVVLIIGGAAEALEARPDSYRLKLKQRKGFVKLALKHGAPLVPCFAFGENDLYTQVPNPEGSRLRTVQQKMTQICGFSPPIFQGRGIFNYSFGLMPHRRAIHAVVGSPIDVEQVDTPTTEQIDDLHRKYVDSLVTLFEQHKSTYGVEDDKHLSFF